MIDLNTLVGEIRSIAQMEEPGKYHAFEYLLSKHQFDQEQFNEMLPFFLSILGASYQIALDIPIRSFMMPFVSSINMLISDDEDYKTHYYINFIEEMLNTRKKMDNPAPLSIYVNEAFLDRQVGLRIPAYIELMKTASIIKTWSIGGDVSRNIARNAMNLKELWLMGMYSSRSLYQLVQEHIYFRYVDTFPKLQTIYLVNHCSYTTMLFADRIAVNQALIAANVTLMGWNPKEGDVVLAGVIPQS